MDIHVFNRNFNVLGVIDDYTSCIWTPKYSECGDFELYVAASCEMVTLLKKNYYLVRSTDITVSNGVVTYKKVMIIKNIQLSTNVENGDYLTVTGRELKFILGSRIIWDTTTLIGNVGDCINKIVSQNCISPTDTKRKIPYLTVSPVPAEIRDSITKQYTGTNILEAIEEICTTYGIGYELNVKVNNGVVTMPLQLYKGVNRSYSQSLNPVVLFSDTYDNLYSTEYSLNTENYCNVAKIGGEDEGSARVYTEIGTATGLDRYELFVDAKDIKSEDNPDIELIVAQLRADIADKETEITNTESQLESVGNERDTVSIALNDINNNISNLENTLNAQYTTIRDLNTQIRQIEAEITSANIYLNSLLEQRQKAIEEGYEAKVKEYNILIDEQNYKINTLVGNLNEKKAELTAAETLRDGLLTEYNNATTTRNQKETELDRLDFNIYELDNSLSILNDELDSLNNQLTTALSYAYVELLKERGRDKVAETAITEEFNGEILEDVAYKLGRDYNLGDIVTVISDYGITANSRILSIIESVGEDGTVSMIPNFGTWEG